MKGIKNSLKIVFFLLPAFMLFSCEKEDITFDSTGDEIADKVTDVICTNWHTSALNVRKKMKDYMEIAFEDDFLQYEDANGVVTISYSFTNDSLGSAVAILPAKEITNLSKHLNNYTYMGEISGKKVYTSEKYNSICLCYNLSSGNDAYTVLGFTPISSPLYEEIFPIKISTKNAIYDVETKTATITGEISGINSGVTVTLCYSTDPDFQDMKTISRSSNSEFTFTINDLSSNATYYYRCRILIGSLYYTSETKSFKTK